MGFSADVLSWIKEYQILSGTFAGALAVVITVIGWYISSRIRKSRSPKSTKSPRPQPTTQIGKGNCWDNAVMESFFGSLKTEWTFDKSYKTRAEAMQDVFKYVEVFYNRKRRHASVGYVSPAAYEELYESMVTQAA